MSSGTVRLDSLREVFWDAQILLEALFGFGKVLFGRRKVPPGTTSNSVSIYLISVSGFTFLGNRGHRSVDTDTSF